MKSKWKANIELEVTTDLDKEAFEEFIKDLLTDFQGTTYHTDSVKLVVSKAAAPNDLV